MLSAMISLVRWTYPTKLEGGIEKSSTNTEQICSQDSRDGKEYIIPFVPMDIPSETPMVLNWKPYNCGSWHGAATRWTTFGLSMSKGAHPGNNRGLEATLRDHCMLSQVISNTQPNFPKQKFGWSPQRQVSRCPCQPLSSHLHPRRANAYCMDCPDTTQKQCRPATKSKHVQLNQRDSIHNLQRRVKLFTYPDSHHITAEFFTVPKHPLPSYVSLTHFNWSPFNRAKSSTGFTVEKSIHPHACAFFKSSGVMPTAWSIACDAPCTLGSVKARETLASVELFLAKLHVGATRHDYMYFK